MLVVVAVVVVAIAAAMALATFAVVAAAAAAAGGRTSVAVDVLRQMRLTLPLVDVAEILAADEGPLLALVVALLLGLPVVSEPPVVVFGRQVVPVAAAVVAVALRQQPELSPVVLEEAKKPEG